MINKFKESKAMKKVLFMLLGFVGCAVLPSHAAPVYTREQAVVITSTYPTSATAGTVTFSTPVAASTFSSGEYTYLTGVYITAFASATVAGTAPVQCTSVNLGGWTEDFAAALTVGTLQTAYHDYTGVVSSTSPAKLSSITCPATPALRWNMRFHYYTAP